MGGIFGGNDDASEAAEVQAASADKAIDLQRETLETVRSDLAPFRAAGQGQLAPLTGSINNLSELVNDPNRQRAFVADNPFFTALADDAQRRIFGNAAARGKVGSGGTAEALQNSLLLLGPQLVGQNVAQQQGVIGARSNLAALGANAAAGQSTATQQVSNNITDLVTGQGNARAAGIVGDANTNRQGGANLLNLGLGIGALALSDERFKSEMIPVDWIDFGGHQAYAYRLEGDPTPRIGVSAQEVQRERPDAVHELEGVLYVDYGALVGNGERVIEGTIEEDVTYAS
jgi:hypothetical protein